MKKITIFTDGACSGNPGPGGFGAILRYNDHEKELSGGFADTTNNRMELLAVITGLEALREPCEVTIVTDSQYVVNGIEKGWAKRWKANNWMRNRNEKASNIDLWERLLNQLSMHKARFQWIRGHAGHPENERCDALAVRAASQAGLPRDIRT